MHPRHAAKSILTALAPGGILLLGLAPAHTGDRSGSLTGPFGNSVERRVTVDLETGWRTAVTRGPAGNTIVVDSAVQQRESGRVVTTSTTGPRGNTSGGSAGVERTEGERKATRTVTGPVGNSQTTVRTQKKSE